MMVKVEHLSKQYGVTRALDDISFEIERGETVGFLGPNGAGKTTTMRILTGYTPATSGRAWIAGHDVARRSLEARRCIGYMPEGVSPYPEMRVHEYLLYRARIKGVPRRERRRRVEEVLDRCRIRDVRRRLVGHLSKGYRQRVALADALVHDPPILILDEPTVGLDPNQIREVRQLIRTLGRDRTILLSTHILPEVEMVCGRVLILHEGRLVFGDTLDHIAASGAGGSRIVLEARADAGGAERLRRLPGVREVSADPVGDFTRFRVELASPLDLREAVARCAAEAGWLVRELRLERPTLEETFVRLTAEEAA